MVSRARKLSIEVLSPSTSAWLAYAAPFSLGEHDREGFARPLLDVMKNWLQDALSQLPRKSDVATAIRYALTLWDALVRYADDDSIEIDNSTAEPALRGVALGRKNYLFAGSDAGGERAATFYALIGSARLNGLDPEAYLRHILTHIAEHPISRIEESLPWHIAPSLQLLSQLVAYRTPLLTPTCCRTSPT